MVSYALSRRSRAADVLRRVGRWHPQRGWYRPKLTWLAPISPFMLIVLSALVGIQLPRIIGGLAALGLLLILVKRPTFCLLAVVPYVTFQQVGLPLLWSFGMPGQIGRQLGAMKDLLGIALVVAAFMEIYRKKRKLDLIDGLALTYIVYVLINALAPQLFYQLLPTTLNTRLLAFRYDAGYVLLFFAVRHAPFADNIREKFLKMLLIMTGVLVAGGLWQRLLTANFTNFILNTVKLDQYAVAVQHIPGYLLENQNLLNQRPLQVGSLVIAPHDFADLMVVALPFVLERAARAHRWRRSLAVLALIVLMILLSGVRANLIAAGVAFALVLLPRRGRTSFARVGLVALLVVGSVGTLPLLHGTRIGGAGTASISNQQHLGEFSHAVQLMTHDPLGLGLGNNPATGDRFQLSYTQQGALTGDNSFLQVGDELGVFAMVTYTAMLVALFAALIRRGREDPFPSATLLAFAGIWVAGMFHHVFLSFPAAWALWAAVGLSLARTDARAAELPSSRRGGRFTAGPT
jgi:hypothetical protein